MRRFLTALLLVAGTASAETRVFEDWKVEAVDSNTVAAYTTNDSGAVFGKLCYVESANCIWVISSSLTCDANAQYPVLANSGSGASMSMLTCIGQKKLGQLMTFNNYESIETISQNDDMVGFAFPMEDGQFRVVRFSLNGSVGATGLAEQAVLTVSRSSTTDLTL